MTVELNEKILHDAGIGSFFRPSQLEPLGIPYHRLRQLEKDETVERIGWGLYRLAAADLTMSYSAALVSARVPNSIICLLSALQAHEIGTQLPHQIWLAIPHKAKPPVLPYLATRLVPLQRRGLDLWRPGDGIRRRAGPHHVAGAHRRRLFPLPAPDREGSGDRGAAGGAVGRQGDHGGADAHA